MTCECGCGEETRLAWRTDNSRGWKKGEPLRFKLGHNNRGRQIRRRDPSTLTNDYGTIHDWMAYHWTKSGRCEECGEEKKTQWAFLRHPEQHTRERSDYRELCSRCHLAMDGNTVRHPN